MSRGQSVFPSLAYEDAERAVEWLAGTFGFEVILSVPGDGGGIVHAELRTSDGDIVMVISTQHSTRRSRSPRSLGGTAQSVYVVTPDVDGLHRRALDAGAEVFNPIHDTDHGREFCCFDPEGHIWTFGTYRPDAAMRARAESYDPNGAHGLEGMKRTIELNRRASPDLRLLSRIRSPRATR